MCAVLFAWIVLKFDLRSCLAVNTLPWNYTSEIRYLTLCLCSLFSSGSCNKACIRMSYIWLSTILCFFYRFYNFNKLQFLFIFPFTLLHRRSESELDRRSEHILTNRATTFLINNLLNRQWRTPKYYPNDIYEPYHQRTGVPWDYRLRKPKFFPWML